MIPNAKNILVINFGQLGDVVLSLTAMESIRQTFPEAKLTALAGKSTAFLVKMTGFFDDVIPVDRVLLRDSDKIWAVKEIFKLVGDIRKRKFDLVIDLHSLPETNLLGFLSGAKLRLFANRGSRSLDVLSNFRPKPPAFEFSDDISKQYLRALAPLGISADRAEFHLIPRASDIAKADDIANRGGFAGESLIGINIGAGHPSRFWGLDNFAELAERLVELKRYRILIFFGPEEAQIKDEIAARMPDKALLFGELDLGELTAMFARLKLLIGGDTGPLHIGASTGIPVIFLSNPLTFYPPGGNVYSAADAAGEKVSVDRVMKVFRQIESKLDLPQNDCDNEKEPDKDEDRDG